ncbi:phage protein [Virgibacillus kapii]|uniref:Phage protein n=1 Tax=Virgibacillus kapii TaxID=1638645 RepID=A0ABQ2E258_9BACI|nr:hypothetical protein [Virgibacillus kapii]GGJ77303.1 phage protein [Virgibacillus kapii]
MSKHNQTEANKKWQEKNKERTRYLNKRSTARNFVRKHATPEDLEELKALIKEREAESSES